MTDLHIDAAGTVRCVCNDSLDLAAIGPQRIHRASHVEPTFDARWIADLSPVGGPQLGPFARRADAIAAEAAWLNHNLHSLKEPTSEPSPSSP